MKNLTKFMQIIAIVAIIAGVAACGGGGGDETPKDLSGIITFTVVRNGIPASFTDLYTGTELTGHYTGSEAVTYQWKINETDVGTNSEKYTPETAGSCTLTVSAEGYNPKTSDAVTVKAIPSWTAVADSKFGTDEIKCITYKSSTVANSKFIAGGENGKMAYSSDGETWTAVTDSTFGTGTIYSIVSFSNKFIAVGTDSSHSGKMAVSSDGGDTWTDITGHTFTGGIYAIAENGSSNRKIVAGGASGHIEYSSDGETWTAVTDSTFGSDYINSINYGNGKFVAVGANGKIAYSSDGETWTAVAESPFGTTQIFSIAGLKYVAVGADGKTATSSNGGETWTTLVNTAFGDAYIYSVASGGTFCSYVAVGSGGKAAYLQPYGGETWVAFADTTFTDNINAVAYGNTNFVACGKNGKMATLAGK